MENSKATQKIVVGTRLLELALGMNLGTRHRLVWTSECTDQVCDI